MTFREQKNQRIKESILATIEKRKNQVPLVFEFKVRNEKRNRKNGTFDRLKCCFTEAKWVKNSMIDQMNKKKYGDSARKVSSFTQKEFTKVSHLDKSGNVIETEVECLMSSMRDAVITQTKRELKTLNRLKKAGYKVGWLKFKSDCTSIELKQYGLTHQVCDTNSYRVQGFDSEIRVAGMRQLRHLDKIGMEYEMSVAKLAHRGESYYILQTVYVDKEQWLSYKESKKNWSKNRNIENPEDKLPEYNINALDLGCMTTATDAYGNKYNAQIEETERLKRLQRKFNRQLVDKGWNGKKKNRKKIKNSNRMCKTLVQIEREYEKMCNVKKNAAIEFCNKVLNESHVLVIQDENLSGWQQNNHGRKVQHGILGLVKKRLACSSQVHVIDRWVPTTKLCTHCGMMHDDIKQSDRKFVCPHCGHDDGDRDVHSAKDMVWLYLNMPQKIGLDGSEFTRGDFDEGVRELFFSDETIEG